MSAPLSYSTECVPRALAAVTGLSAVEAAELLWPLRSPPAAARAPGGTVPVTHGAWPHDVAEALLLLGWTPELFDGRGVPYLEASAYVRFLRRRAQRSAVRVRRPGGPVASARRPPRGGWSYATPPVPRLHREPAREHPDVRLTVATWLRTFPASTWVLFVRSHALAARAGRIVAGGDDYGRFHVRDAIRVLDTHPQDLLP